jgi:hypothetical protein
MRRYEGACVLIVDQNTPIYPLGVHYLEELGYHT